MKRRRAICSICDASVKTDSNLHKAADFCITPSDNYADIAIFRMISLFMFNFLCSKGRCDLLSTFESHVQPPMEKYI